MISIPSSTFQFSRSYLLFAVLFVVLYFYTGDTVHTTSEESNTNCDFLVFSKYENYKENANKLFGFLAEQDNIDGFFSNSVVMFVSCNWYDKGKIKKIVEFSKRFPNSKIVITGGLGRLSSSKAQQLGGEALEIRELLLAEIAEHNYSKENTFASRLAIVTGLKTTGDNVQMLLKMIDSFALYDESLENNVTIIAVEESFLIRRLRATIGAQLQARKTECYKCSDIRNAYVVSSGAESFDELTTMHRSKVEVALYMMSQEIQRLHDYSNPQNTPYLFDSQTAFASKKSSITVEQIDNIVEKIKSEFSTIFQKITETMKNAQRTLHCISPT